MGALQDKAVVITGSGRGIGEAYARLAAAEGARVVVNDVDLAEAERVAGAIRDAGGRAVAKAADISSWSDAEALVAFCVAEFGALDGFVNNAALFHMARSEEETEQRLRRIVEVNVLGSAFCGLHALRQMQKQGRGSLVNITSGAQAGIGAMFAYGATKGATASMTYSWALDLQGTAVRVNAVSPMATTRMAASTADYFRSRGEPRAGRAFEISPENNAPLVVYLLSDLAGGVHGQVVRVQGRALSIMTHPASRHPGVERDKWSVREVAKAFSERLAKQQLPAGVQAYEVKLREYSVPYATGGTPSRKATARKKAAKPVRGKAKAARRAKR